MLGPEPAEASLESRPTFTSQTSRVAPAVIAAVPLSRRSTPTKCSIASVLATTVRSRSELMASG